MDVRCRYCKTETETKTGWLLASDLMRQKTERKTKGVVLPVDWSLSMDALCGKCFSGARLFPQIELQPYMSSQFVLCRLVLKRPEPSALHQHAQSVSQAK